MLVELLRVDNIRVVEQAVWAIGCIAGDLPAYRDMVINEGAIGNMLAVLQKIDLK